MGDLIDESRSQLFGSADRVTLVLWQSRKTLVWMTGKDMQYDDAAWLQYLTDTAQPFVG